MHALAFTRVAIVSKIEKDKANIAFAEEHLPLHDLDANYGGLPFEVGIALANINKRKIETEEKRKAGGGKCKSDKSKESAINRTATTASGKENTKPKKVSKMSEGAVGAEGTASY